MQEDSLHEKQEKSCLKKKKSTKLIPLYSFDMIPAFLQSNPYIRTGYRHGLSVKGCLIRYITRINEEKNQIITLIFFLIE